MLKETFLSEIKGIAIKLDVMQFENSTHLDLFLDGVFSERYDIPAFRSNDMIFINDMAYNIIKLQEYKL